MSDDIINHPSHYNQGDIECIDAIAVATADSAGNVAFCQGNVIKYLWRLYGKGKPLEDARKARWYLGRMIKELEKDEKILKKIP